MKQIKILVIVMFFFFLHGCISFQGLFHQKESSGNSLRLNDIIPIDSEVRVGMLENGIRYIIRVNHKPEKRAELRLIVNAGSVLEDEDQQGLAHFCEHMAFNGTKHFAKQKLIDFLESIGMRFGPEINAYTSFDETVYKLELPTDSVQIVKTGFQVLEDWASLLTFEEEEIDKERGVIIEEWRLGRGAESRMRDQQLPILFRGSKYAKRLPIGKKEVIDTCHYETLRQFYRDWYRPDLMAVVAVGDFNPDWIEALIDSHFSKITPIPDARKRELVPVPDHKEPLFTIATDPEATRTSVSLYFKRELTSEKTVVDYRERLVENTYHAMINDRLRELSRKPDPPFLYGYSSFGRFVKSKEVHYLGAGVREDGILQGLETILTEAYRAKQYGFNKSELDRVKKEMLRGIEVAYHERNKTESVIYASEYVRHFLYNEPIPGIEYEFQLFKKYIPGITLEEVNRLASQMITESNRVVFVNGPEKEGLHIPTEEELQNIFHLVEGKKIDLYVDQISKEPLMANSPIPGELVQEKRLDSLDVVEWIFSNGVRVVLKPTDFKNDEIQFNAFSPGGYSQASIENYISAITANSIVREGGIRSLNLVELEKKLAGRVVHVRPFIAALTEGISGSCSPEDLELMFQLIHLYFTSPRRDSTAFLSYKNRMKGYIENRHGQPESVFSDTIAVTMTQYHPNSRPWSISLLEEIQFDSSIEFYQDRFCDASDFIFFFVGNFQIEKIKDLILIYLGSLPALNRQETWRDMGIFPPKGIIDKTVNRGIEPKSLVRIIFTGEYQWSRENNYILESMIQGIRIKFREVLREDMGGTYSVGIGAIKSHFPKERFSISIGFGCDPDRVEELIQRVHMQIDSLKNFGLDSSYIDKVKEAQLRQYEENLEKNGYWLGFLYSAYLHQQDPMDIMTYDSLVKQLQVEDIHQAVRTYFSTGNMATFVLLPEKSDLGED